MRVKLEGKNNTGRAEGRDGVGGEDRWRKR